MIFTACSLRPLQLFRVSTAAVRAYSVTSGVPALLRRPTIYTVPSCHLRTRSGHEGHGHHEKTTGEAPDPAESEKSEEKEEGNEQQKKKEIDPALRNLVYLCNLGARKLRMYVLAVGGLSFVTSFFLLAQMFKEGNGMPEGANSEHFTKPGIEFNVFVQKYLKVGEVKSIVFCPQAFKAVAYLHEGAIIDGQKAREPFVVISYSNNPREFWEDVRREESLMGISLTNGVPITMYQGLTTWKVVELLIGFLIIAWLGTQYGRLLRKRILANKTPPPPK